MTTTTNLIKILNHFNIPFKEQKTRLFTLLIIRNSETLILKSMSEQLGIKLQNIDLHGIRMVHDSLDLENLSQITELPNYLEVDGYLNIRGTGIKKLPHNLKVSKWINMEKDVELNKNLKVDELNLMGTNISKLPYGIKVRMLYVNDLIKYIPNDSQIQIIKDKDGNIINLPTEFEYKQIEKMNKHEHIIQKQEQYEYQPDELNINPNEITRIWEMSKCIDCGAVIDLTIEKTPDDDGMICPRCGGNLSLPIYSDDEYFNNENEEEIKENIIQQQDEYEYHPSELNINPPKSFKRTICIDLDGVIFDYSEGWQGNAYVGKPIKGAIEYINKLKSQGWTVLIHTARVDKGRTKKYVKRFLKKHGIKYDKILPKPVAEIYLDDRAIKFKGNWKKTYNEINNFKVWYNPPEPIHVTYYKEPDKNGLCINKEYFIIHKKLKTFAIYKGLSKEKQIWIKINKYGETPKNKTEMIVGKPETIKNAVWNKVYGWLEIQKDNPLKKYYYDFIFGVGYVKRRKI